MTATSAVAGIPDASARAEPITRRGTLALAGLYYLLAALAVTLWLWRDPASRMVAGNPNDADQMAWFFRYDATAVAHLHLPALVTTAMNAPQGVNAMWNTFMLLPGIVLAPVTLLAGPQTSLTVVMTLGFAGSSLALFTVLRRWDVSVTAAAIAGTIYGFSPAVAHSAIGHYDLMFAVFPPLIVDTVIRLLAGRLGPRRGGVELGLMVTAQLFITEEILFDTALAGALLLLVLGLRRKPLGDRPWQRLKATAAGLGLGAAITLVMAGYPLWVQFFGPLPQHGSPFTIDFFKNDLSSLVVPSALMLIHTSGDAATAARYQGQLPEYLGYLGWPLLIVLIAVTAWFWRRPAIRALGVTWAVLDVFSLGGTLLISGHEHTAAKLPWYWVQSLPLLNAVLPDRFSLVADGAAAAVLAFAADAAVPRFAAFTTRFESGRLEGRFAAARLAVVRSAIVRSAVRRPAVVVMSCAALVVLPILPRPLPATTATPLPAGWTTVFDDLRLPRSAPVLVVPIPLATFTEPLRWQAESGEPGAMVGGYFMGPAWNGQVYIDGNGTPPAGQYLNQVWRASAVSLPAVLTAEAPLNATPTSGRSGSTKAATTAQMKAQVKAWRAAAVVAVATPGSGLDDYLSFLFGQPAAASGDVVAWRVPPGW